MLKKIISVILLFFLFSINICASSVELTSDKYILVNLTDDIVLLEKNSNDKTQIASLTKIMNVLISIENIKDYNAKVVITKEMLEGLTWDIATIKLKVGDILTYDDLLYAAMLPSAADAANALAISVSGSYENHLIKMNKKAEELNLKNTHFSNVVGLSDENNYSSAYDILVLLKYALRNKKFKEIFKSKSYILSNGNKINTTIYKYDNEYIVGSKTGFTTKAGRCLASISNFDNADFLFVTLNNYSGGHKYIDETINTYKYYDENYSYKTVASTEDVVATIKTKYAKENEIDLTPNEEYKYYLSNDFDKKNITYEYDGVDELSFFTQKGKLLGKVNIKYKGEVIKSFEIFYKGELTFSLFKFLWIKKFYIIVLVIVMFFLHKKKKKKRRKKVIRRP